MERLNQSDVDAADTIHANITILETNVEYKNDFLHTYHYRVVVGC